MGQRNPYWGAVGVFEEGVMFPDVLSVNLALFFVGFAAWICCISPPLKTYICAWERKNCCYVGKVAYEIWTHLHKGWEERMEVLNLHSKIRGSWNLLKWVDQIDSNQCQGRHWPQGFCYKISTGEKRWGQQTGFCTKSVERGGRKNESASLTKWWSKFFPIPAHLPIASLCRGEMQRETSSRVVVLETWVRFGVGQTWLNITSEGTFFSHNLRNIYFLGKELYDGIEQEIWPQRPCFRWDRQPRARSQWLFPKQPISCSCCGMYQPQGGTTGQWIPVWGKRN